MKKQTVISDTIVQKRLKKIQRKALRGTKKKVRKGQLTKESLELYLGVIDEPYAHLRNELNTGRANTLARLIADLAGRAETAMNTLGLNSDRVQQAYEEAQRHAETVQIPNSEISESNKITIEPLRKRFHALVASQQEKDVR